MQIELSKDEYRNLLDLLVIAEWVQNAHTEDYEKTSAKHHAVEQKIFSYADKLGFSDLIEYDEESQEYFPTAMLDEGESRDFIDEYDNDIFWTELLSRLVERDLIKNIGIEKLKNLSLEKRFKEEQLLIDQYSIEFENNGIDRLGITG